jgi:hypothetical protein
VRGCLADVGRVERHERRCRRTGAAGNDALPAVLDGEIGHKVVRAPDFEGKDIVEVLALEPYFVAQTRAQIAGLDEGGLLDNLVHLRGQDEAKVVGDRVLVHGGSTRFGYKQYVPP